MLAQPSQGSSLPTVSLFLFAIVVILVALAFLVIKASPSAKANRSLAAANLSTAVWVLGIAGLQIGTNLDLWLAVAFSGASFIAVTLLCLVRHYPVKTSSPSLLVLIIGFSLAAWFTYCSAATSLLFSRPRVVVGSLVRDTGPLYSLFCAYFLVSWVIALVVLVRKWRLATSKQRTQLRYFGSGIMLAGAGGATTNLLIPYLTGSSSYNWLGPCFVFPFIVLATHSIIRHHLLDLRLVFHRSLSEVLAYIIALAPILAVILLVLPGTDGELRSYGTIVASLLLAGLLTPLVRDVFNGLLDRYFYRVRSNYRRTVRESSALLTRVHNVESLLDAIAGHIVGAFRAEGVVIYACDDQSVSRSVVHANSENRFESPETIPAIILNSLQGTPRGFLGRPSELPSESPDRARSLRVALTKLNWALVLPLLTDDTVIGAIAIGPKLSGDPYYPQDLDLLATLANQAGIAVKNAQLYAEVVLANEYVENIVTTINSGVVAINAAGRVTLFNRAAEHLTGLPAAAVRLEPTSLLPRCLGEPLARTVAEGRAITYPEIALPGGATTRPVICTVSPLRDAAGSILGGVAVFSDLTPLKELEVERRRAEKLAYFKLLASGFAHEIKNPLVSVKTFVQLVPLRLDDRRWLEEFSRIVHREIERLERLLQRLASLGHAHERPQCLLDLRLPIREALELMKPEFAERRISVAVRLGERDHTILGDHDELKQLAHNLLLNALQHTPVDGGVTVELGVVEDRAVLTVADTGPGIAIDLLERIFDPFVTTRKHGTGLGLAICTGIAVAHRARLHAANHAAGGATFTVEFPLVTSVPATVSA